MSAPYSPAMGGSFRGRGPGELASRPDGLPFGRGHPESSRGRGFLAALAPGGRGRHGGLGLRRCRLAPGAHDMPAHVHDDRRSSSTSCAGEGVSWRTGRRTRSARATRSCTARAARTHPSSGPGMTAIVFGERRPVEVGRLPRAGRADRAPVDRPRRARSFAPEAAAGPVATGGPARRARGRSSRDDVPAQDRDRGEFGGCAQHRRRARVAADGHAPPRSPPAGSTRRRTPTTPKRSCSSSSTATGTRALRPRRRCHRGDRPPRRPRRRAARRARASPTPSAAAMPHDVLSFGQRKREDVAWYPRSSKLAFRGLSGSGVIGGIVVKVERAGFWDGRRDARALGRRRARRREVGDMRAWWRDSGAPRDRARSACSASRSTPARARTGALHLSEEEIFFVLGGRGLAWIDGASTRSAPDTIVYPAGGPAHTLIAGDDGLDVLCFGENPDPPLVHLPRAGVLRRGRRWLAATHPDPLEREARPARSSCPSRRPARSGSPRSRTPRSTSTRWARSTPPSATSPRRGRGAHAACATSTIAPGRTSARRTGTQPSTSCS